LPKGWPATLQLGMANGLGQIGMMTPTAPFGFRYQYLAGGVNTGKSWTTWSPNGTFVTDYIRESLENKQLPVLTYYMLNQSKPGDPQSESKADLGNLQNMDTMTAFYKDLQLFFRSAGTFKEPVVLHLEPDLWGFAQSQFKSDDAALIPVKVGSTRIPELSGLPENLIGFSSAIIRLRDQLAPNVLLAYHLSTWGTGKDPIRSKPDPAQNQVLAERSAKFYKSLNANFDLVFAEFSDRDAAFKESEYHDGGVSWWSPEDFARNLQYISTFVHQTGKRVVMWQVPYGNTKMRAMNNTRNHYQDNRVEWLLDDPSRGHLNDYMQAGVIAFLFGRGADGATCACDGNDDGVTNPAPINGNDMLSFNSDDDGGFFRQKARDYYLQGPAVLP
jgi:hypothetical protein